MFRKPLFRPRPTRRPRAVRRSPPKIALKLAAAPSVRHRHTATTRRSAHRRPIPARQLRRRFIAPAALLPRHRRPTVPARRLPSPPPTPARPRRHRPLLSSTAMLSYTIPPPGLDTLAVLKSFFYFRHKDMRALVRQEYSPPLPRLFADSGAFSAFSLGQKLNVHEYCDWLLRYHDLFHVYANLDVKGDVDAGLRNQRTMERYGLHPIPVFHGGEPFSVLKDLIAEYPYIALGGIVGASISIGSLGVRRWLDRCFALAAGKSVFHAFGVTTWDVLCDYPWYSADSTSWLSGVRYGGAIVFDPRAHCFRTLRIATHDFTTYSGMVRAYGFDPAYFLHRSQYHIVYMICLTGRAFLVATDYLRSIRPPVTIPGRPDLPAGPLLYLSSANDPYHSWLDRTYKNWLAGLPPTWNIVPPRTRNANPYHFIGDRFVRH